MRVFRPVFAVLLLACAVWLPLEASAERAAAQEEPEDERVSAAFAWPETLVGEVEVTRHQQTTAGDTSKTRDSKMSFRMQGEDHPEGKLVRFRRFSFEASGEEPESDEAIVTRMQDLADVLPGFVVSPHGGVLRLEALEDTSSEIQAGARQIAGEREIDETRLAATLQALMQEPRLRHTAIEFWDALVQGWAGRDFMVGQVYLREGEQQLPLLGGVPARVNYQTVLRRRLPCPQDEAERERGRKRNCVEFETTTHLEPEAAKQLIASLKKRAASLKLPPPPPIESIAYDTRLLLFSEPEKLIPHRLELRRSASQVVAGERIDSVDQRIYRFSYRRHR